jgi:rare lipoprotein A
MKRIFGVLLAGVIFLILPGVRIDAQTNDQGYTRTFRQRGTATRTMRSNDLAGSHPNLPLGTKVLVTNLQNNRMVTITISGRIAASGNRVIDLSNPAAIALRMEENEVTSVSLEVVRDPQGNATGNVDLLQDYAPPMPPVAPIKRSN